MVRRNDGDTIRDFSTNGKQKQEKALSLQSPTASGAKAEKKQIQYIVQKTFKLKSPPKPDDAADALAIALCAGHYYQKDSRINQ